MNPNWPSVVEPPILLPHQAHVWAVPLAVGSRELNDLTTLLSPNERQRSDTFRLELPRQRFITSRAALRTLLARYLKIRPSDLKLTTDVYGKPHLSDPTIKAAVQFNVAHSHDMALVAFTLNRAVGVDIERLRAIKHSEQIARRYFHPQEIDAICAAAPELRVAAFMRCWTCKEAVLKAIGTGINDSLAEFAVPVSESEQGTYVEVPTRGSAKHIRCWVNALNLSPSYASAVAIVDDECEVRCMSYTPATT